MIYDSIDIIPAKTYFKIIETGQLALLSTKKIPEKKLKTIWSNIEEQHNLIAPNKEVNKILNLSKIIESLSAKFEAINLAVYHLKHKSDPELIELLKSYGYSFSEDLSKDLERIKRESEGIKIKIENLSRRLPKENKNSKQTSISFDESVMVYSAFTGSGYIDTNKITLPQYYALINIANQKINAIENGKR